jgi:hypothetical protein
MILRQHMREVLETELTNLKLAQAADKGTGHSALTVGAFSIQATATAILMVTIADILERLLIKRS